MRAHAVLPAGAWTADPADTVLIDFDRRHRRRIRLTTEAGADLLLDLPQATRLRDGDGLQLEDGRVVRVRARPEALLDIHAHDMAGLVRIAWHLGNRHLPVQLLGHHIRIRADHVIADMVRGLGGHAREIEAPFDPKSGAYAAPATTTTTTMTTTDPAAALVKLLTWLSPAFPTGAFAYSHGLEWAVEHDGVTTEAALLDWLDTVLRHGAGRNDAILLRHAWRADTPAALAEVVALAEAAAPGQERRTETLGQGTAFALAARVWGAPLLEAVDAPAYPVALGVLARAHAVPEDTACRGLLHAFAANLVGAAVRLVPLGQTAGLRVLAALEPAIHAIEAATSGAALDDLGGACFRSDIAALRHETQYTRLFRT